METEKSHGLPFPSWRTRKTGGCNSVQVQRPENLGSDGVNPGLSPKAPEPRVAVYGQEKLDISAPAEHRFALRHLFGLFRPLKDWMMPTFIGEGDLFTQSTDSSVNVFQRHLHRHSPR